MRLLHVVPTYLPATRYGGPIYAVHGLCRALAGRGHQVDVFTTDVDGDHNSNVSLETPVVMDGVNIHYFSTESRSGLNRRLYRSSGMVRALADKTRSFDLVHAHSVFLWPTLAAARTAERMNVPYVVSPRGMLVPELIRRKSSFIKYSWIRLVERRSFRHASAIHFTAQREWDDAMGVSIPLPDPFVVPNGIDLRPAAPATRRDDTLLFLGRVNWKKGLDRLLDAMPLVPGVRTVIAGNDEEGLLPRLRAQAERNGITARVDFAGEVTGLAKETLLRTSTALVLPSISENFGNVVLEAMAAELPVIVTPEVGLASDVEREGAGIVYSGEARELADAIRKLIADRDARNTMGTRGRVLVETAYTWDRVAGQMEAHYEAIIRTKAARRR